MNKITAWDKNATATWWHTFWWWKQNTWISNGFPSHQEYHILPKDAKQALKWLAWHEAVNRKSHIQPEVRVEWGVSTTSNHSELGLSLTCWGWKEVWAWAITVKGDCHLPTERGMRCVHEQSQWIWIVTYLLRVKRGVSINKQSKWIGVVTYFLRVERGLSMSKYYELALSLTC